MESKRVEDAHKSLVLIDTSVDTFYRAIRPIMMFGQLFSLFPVSGLWKKDSDKVRFRWVSLRTIYFFYVALFQVMSIGLAMRRLFRLGLGFATFAAVFFYIVTLYGGLIVFRLGQRWPTLVRRIERTERIFIHTPYRQVGWPMHLRIRVVSFALILGAIAEHLLYIFAKYINAETQLQVCNLNIPTYEHFLRTERRHIYSVIPYQATLAIIIEWANICTTIYWSYFDIIVTMFSLSIAYRMRQLSDRMRRVRFKAMPDAFWIEIRVHFTDLTNLLEFLDKKLSNLIILVCGSNLYFICQQLFNSFSVPPEKLNNVYFWCSLLYVIVRALTMLFCAASINEAAKEPYQLLKALPYTSWSVEIQRFSDQLISEVIGFSGKRFFFITRKLILALIGTIVTYELVLLDHVAEAPEIVQKSCRIAYIAESNMTA
ncbi:Gustatory receptor [Sergentomyia squamirostris]